VLSFSLLSKQNVGFVPFVFCFPRAKGFCTIVFRERRCEALLLFPGTAPTPPFALPPTRGGASAAQRDPAPPAALPGAEQELDQELSIPARAVPPPGDTAAVHGWDGDLLPNPNTLPPRPCLPQGPAAGVFATQLSRSHFLRCWTSQGGG